MVANNLRPRSSKNGPVPDTVQFESHGSRKSIAKAYVLDPSEVTPQQLIPAWIFQIGDGAAECRAGPQKERECGLPIDEPKAINFIRYPQDGSFVIKL
jgi:hypothetical protein